MVKTRPFNLGVVALISSTVKSLVATRLVKAGFAVFCTVHLDSSFIALCSILFQEVKQLLDLIFLGASQVYCRSKGLWPTLVEDDLAVPLSDHGPYLMLSR